ncbi:hypothetical protein NZD89_05500 [Alicyclobacillus fastidiosus]|uniref:Cation-transporting P-type ATPase C-terminal domain-containing protein n=1 Tax=Alicyclobacillus fastidiosus TaxID=392011 RepID=A0ABY6ZLB0_9BACL|nr:hypothetical protein [Alicyclobacillus fastidiosus]WAH42884.1 hypothetical protein NZD89_05500 [Alicyclobacillus fastidiosus]GMA64824.1 hypothetical protein GCM10025859_52640 [Alicyclobacillus fastidiosus]
MNRLANQQVILIYASAVLAMIVFLPNLLLLDRGVGHLLEHLALIVAGGVFTFSVERLRQMAVDRKYSSVRPQD